MPPEPFCYNDAPMKTLRLAPVLLVALLAGCATQLKHEISVSRDLREVPVRTVFVFDPVFPEKAKRRNPEDLQHMLPDRATANSVRIRDAVTKALSTSLTVDSTVVLDPAAREWAQRIGRDLSRGRVPLVVDPIDLPVESVMLIGVKKFGWENTQLQMTFLWFEKRKKFGPPKYDHYVALQMILVNPRTGAVLMDALDEQRRTVREGAVGSDEVLDEVLAGVARELTGSFPEPPGGWVKPAAAAPLAPAEVSATPAAGSLVPAPTASSTVPR